MPSVIDEARTKAKKPFSIGDEVTFTKPEKPNAGFGITPAESRVCTVTGIQISWLKSKLSDPTNIVITDPSMLEPAPAPAGGRRTKRRPRRRNTFAS